MVHSLFGYALMGASFARMVELVFVLKEQRNADEALAVGVMQPAAGTSTSGQTMAALSPCIFSHLPAYLMVAAGILFASATNEEMHWADAQGIDGSTWVMMDFSWAFMVFFYTCVLVDKYTSWGGRFGQRNTAARAAALQDRESLYQPSSHETLIGRAVEVMS